jgi:ribonuclease P protein component
MFESIKKNTEFRTIYGHKRSIADRNLVLYCWPKRMPNPRLGISISKKVGKAVLRNRIKRQIKEIMHCNQQACDCPYDIIFVVRAACAEASFSEIEASCLKLIKQAVKKWHK